MRPIHPTKFVTIMSRSFFFFLSFFLHLPFIFYLSCFFSRFYFFLFSVRFSSYHFHCSFLSLLWKMRPPQEQNTTCMPMALTFKLPATTKRQQCKPRNTLPHTVPVNIREPTWVTSSIEPTINENVLPLTSTAELSFTQALTHLAINRKHQIYCSTQQVTSSRGHAMAREHQRRYSHYSCWCHQPAYTDTGYKTPLRSQLRTAKSHWQTAYPSVSQHVHLETCPLLTIWRLTTTIWVVPHS